MQDLEVAPALVRRLWDETPSLQGAVLEVSPELASRYTRPGQVIIADAPQGDRVYLALASHPGEARAFELLLGTSAREKLAWSEGREVSIAPPSGKGFPVEMARGRDVLLFAVGSAIAPMRALLEVLCGHRAEYRKITFYMGAHADQDFPYQREYPSWAREGVELVRSVSRPWVQERFVADQPDIENAVAFVAGMSHMVDDVTKALRAAGMPEERIGLNW